MTESRPDFRRSLIKRHFSRSYVQTSAGVTISNVTKYLKVKPPTENMFFRLIKP